MSTELQKIQSSEVYLFVNLLLGKPAAHYMERYSHGSSIPVQ